MSNVTLNTFGQVSPAKTAGDSGSSGGGTAFSVTLDSNGEQTLDVTTLGLETTTGKQVSGIACKYATDGTFVTANVLYKILDSTHFYFYSTAQTVQNGLVITGTITDSPTA